MVNKNLNNNGDINFMPEPLKYNFISLSEVCSNNLRLEANSFNVDAKNAKEKILKNKYGSIYLTPNGSYIEKIYDSSRFKRNYVPKNTPNSLGFLGSAEMLDIKPNPVKHIPISRAQEKKLLVDTGAVLLSCSGTIGRSIFVGKTNKKYAYSEHVIRLVCKTAPGYLYAFLKCKEFQHQIHSLNYGAVINEVEPNHLENIVIPDAPDKLKNDIHNDVAESYNHRDKSNDLIDKAEAMLYKELQLKPVEELKPTYFSSKENLRNFSMKLSQLKLRLDGSYHVPIANLVEKAIKKHSQEIITIGDLAERIILAGIFKRHYVKKENGVPFLGGKDINQLTPDIKKYLSKSLHKDRIKDELEVFENYVLITAGGTIGKVQIVPKHWNGWAVSQHVVKIVPISDDVAGYLYCFLNSDYGKILIERETYGAVIDTIGDNNVANIKIPILKNKDRQKEINDLVLEANNLRYKAYLKEQSAIKKMEDIINDIA